MKLPDGVTVEGKTEYIDGIVTHSDEVREVSKGLRLRSGGKLRYKDHKRGAHYTKIYTKEEIRRMEMEKFYKQNADWLRENPGGQNIDLCLAALGTTGEFKNTTDIATIIKDATGKAIGHNVSTLMKEMFNGTLGSLFIEATDEYRKSYRLTDLGAIVGTRCLKKIYRDPLPKSKTKLRLLLAEACRIATREGIHIKDFESAVGIPVSEPEAPVSEAPVFEAPAAPRSISGITFKLGFRDGVVHGEVRFIHED